MDGMEYKTDISDFQVGIGNRKVETLILDEGITEVKTAIFNSCKVKTVFFPHSMTNVYDYTLSYLHPDKGETISIYYAGTQEEWSDIFTEYQRTNVGDTNGFPFIRMQVGQRIIIDICHAVREKYSFYLA